MLEPRAAAMAFGRIRAGAARPDEARHAEAIARALATATPNDCLDAAFTLAAEAVHPTHPARRRSPDPAEPRPFDDTDYYHAIATWLGCPFDPGPGLGPLIGNALIDARMEFHVGEDGDGMLARVKLRGRQLVVMSPGAPWLAPLAALIAREPSAAERIIISVPSVLHQIGGTAGPGREVAGRINPLHTIEEDAIADRVTTLTQRLAIGAATLGAAWALLMMPGVIAPLVIVVVTLVLLVYAASRSVALLEERSYPPRRRLKTGELPPYSVLIPLYKEDKGLAGLVHALRLIDYPPDKLDIMFLVEAHDEITRAALARETDDLPCRVVVLPSGKPQTKPRALNAGLRQARGYYVTVFDAEDRPHPRQLRVAAETFAAAPAHVAGLQARLSIDHIGENWLTAMFAIEYACLFERIMPLVAGHGRLVLLGGTSNHFRRDVLIESGGWDPFNVTEDADLAVRLRRMGYTLWMIDSYTSEEAPVTANAWLKQRSRWFKGFMQTWLVHNRQPIALLRDIGWRDTLLFHVYIVGAILAAVSHLVFTAQIIVAGLGYYSLFSGPHQWLTAFQIAAVTFGYGASFAVGALSLGGLRNGRGPLPFRLVLWFPVYWMLMGGAAMLALYDLIRRPHHWRKTEHGIGVRPGRARWRKQRAAP